MGIKNITNGYGHDILYLLFLASQHVIGQDASQASLQAIKNNNNYYFTVAPITAISAVISRENKMLTV